MKRFSILAALLLLGITYFGCGAKEEVSTGEISISTQEEDLLRGISTLGKSGKFEGFIVYLDQGYFKNHFAPSGWMGDFGDIRINEGSRENPYSRNSCIKVTYTALASQNASWAGVYWQSPANNWGQLKGGYDLTGAKALTFWARGEKGGEVVNKFMMGGISGTYSDSDSITIGPITLTNEWKKYEIDLTGLDLSYISGGFGWVANIDSNTEGVTFYLDDIRYE